MLQITIDTNQATRRELIATSNYLKELADSEVKIVVQNTGAGSTDGSHLKSQLGIIKDAVRETVNTAPVIGLGNAVAALPYGAEQAKPDEYLAGIDRVPTPPFPHGEGFDESASQGQVTIAHSDTAGVVTCVAPVPTLADQARATFGAAAVSTPATAVDPVLAAFANQGAAALPNGALSTAAAPPIVTAPVAPPENSAPSISTPSAPPAPPAPVVQTAAPATSANVDKNGLPWDERIHAGTKVKVADGTWRMKRNVDPALVTSVTEELRALMAVPAPPAEPWPFAVPGASAAPNVPTPAPAPPSPTIQTSAPVVTATPGPDVAVANLAAAASFGELMGAIPGLVGEQLLTFEEVLKAATEIGLPNGVQGLVARPDLIVPLRTALLAVVQS